MRTTFGSVLIAALAALIASCKSLPPEHRPDNRPQAAWEKELQALRCHYYPRTLAVRSRNPLVFAVMGSCNPERPHEDPADPAASGYYWLISVDAGESRARATRISSNLAGGLHYTESGDLMWFSATAPGPTAQRFLDVVKAPAATLEPRTVGRLEMPFYVATPAVTRGEGCYVLSVYGTHDAKSGAYSMYHWIVRGEDPLASAKEVQGIGRILYWNPVGKYFVTQAPKLEKTLKRARLNCSGEVSPLESEEATRLEAITDADATFKALVNGDLVAANETRQEGHFAGTEILMFRAGHEVKRFGPFERDYPPCPDLACAPFGLPAQLVDASPSGRHVVAVVGLVETFGVYGVSEPKLVRTWSTRRDSTWYVSVMIDDNTLLQLQDESRIAYYSW